jgi:hypothetical protein
MKKNIQQINIFKNFNKISNVKKNTIFIYGNYLDNILWYERKRSDSSMSSMLNLSNKLQTKYSILHLNKWLEYCNQKKINDISIYIDNVNVKLLNKYIQESNISNEEFNLKNISLKYTDSLISFYNKKNDIRKINIFSTIINKQNYKEELLLNLLNNTKTSFYKFNNLTNPIFDKTKLFDYNRLYIEYLPNTDVVIKKIYDFQNKLEKEYSNHSNDIFNKMQKKYKKHFYINNINVNDFYEFNEEINKIHKNIPLDFCIYVPKNLIENYLEKKYWNSSIIQSI